MSREISTIILAAGASTRMKGSIKQLLPWGNHSLLEHAVAQARPISKEVYVVLGAHADKIKASLTLPADVIENPNWKLGMGSSIVAGVKAIMDSASSPSGVLLMLADQPLIDSPYLDVLKRTFIHGNHKIVATTYGNRWGVPAIFHHSLLPELCDLNEEFGAREIIAKHKTSGISVRPNGRERDIDTIENYNQLFELQNFNNENI